uniref:Immunoglobulin domain-containing protein n=1 Tax=Paramormyrops kingsleyae TaxID=1676925 RepID=A0A3B3RB76_9TELE
QTIAHLWVIWGDLSTWRKPYDDPDVGTVGDSVQFLVSTDSHNGFLFISWTVNGSTILTFDGTNIITAPVYNERINFDITTGSLELKNLTLHDSGTYQLQIVAAGEPQVQEVILNVLGELQHKLNNIKFLK